MTPSNSNSNLLNYISLLLSDDEALQRFLIDPITDAEGKYGITKAERAVLRRTVFHLSNRSLNGYTLVRHLDSYRRSLRLLQNVLYNVGSKMVQDAHSIEMLPAQQQAGTTAGQYKFSMIYSFPRIPFNGPTNLTGLTNAQLQAQYGGPYAIQTRTFNVYLDIPNPTIQFVMDEVSRVYFQGALSYTTVNLGGDDFVRSILFQVLGGNFGWEAIADLSNPIYKQPNANFVFWFWSINGRANPTTGGNLGQSFAITTLQPCDTVFWQLIAPDARYGFQPCTAAPGNAFAEAAKASKA